MVKMSKTNIHIKIRLRLALANLPLTMQPKQSKRRSERIKNQFIGLNISLDHNYLQREANIRTIANRIAASEKNRHKLATTMRTHRGTTLCEDKPQDDNVPCNSSESEISVDVEVLVQQSSNVMLAESDSQTMQTSKQDKPESAPQSPPTESEPAKKTQKSSTRVIARSSFKTGGNFHAVGNAANQMNKRMAHIERMARMAHKERQMAHKERMARMAHKERQMAHREQMAQIVASRHNGTSMELVDALNKLV